MVMLGRCHRNKSDLLKCMMCGWFVFGGVHTQDVGKDAMDHEILILSCSINQD